MTIQEQIENIAYKLIRRETNRFDRDDISDTELGNYVKGVVQMQTEINSMMKGWGGIPKGATNGDMIKALFPNAEFDYHEKNDIVDEYVTVFIKDCDTCQDYPAEWWNAPYKGGNIK